MRILLIDDDPGIQAVARLALERVGGFQVRLCGSGREALKAAPEFMPDIVLLDVSMPDMDGPETFEALRKIPQISNIPIVFLTANTQPDDIAGYKKLGAAGVLAKPFDPMKLSEAVSTLLKQHNFREETDISARFNMLQEKYAEQIPLKISRLNDLWNRLKSDNFDKPVLKEMHLIAHSLSGSGDTFGFPALSFAANRLELLLKDIMKKNIPCTDELISGISTLLEDLKESGAKPCVKGASVGPYKISKAAGPLPKQGTDSRLIILLGNDPFLMHELSPHLGYFGYTIQSLLKPEGLKEILAGTLPCAIIADITTDENKASCMESVKSTRETAALSVPIIFISDSNDPDIHLQTVRIGGEAFFTKPVDISRLIDKLDSFTSPLAQEPYRVLIVDDEPVLASQYELILQQSNMITAVVTNPMEIMQPLSEFRPELILMDVYMPEYDGMELAKMIRQKETFVSIPIVFLSSEKDIEKQLTAMSLGGDDFLTKPIKASHLVSSIASRVERYRILRSFMIRDSLTGLLNHTRTKEQLIIEVSRIERTQSQLAFAIIDIDHFKLVNDNYGHFTGDQVIKSLSRLLQQRLRKADTIGRYGGEEFAVILNDMDGHTAVKILDKIRGDFAMIQHNCKGQKFPVTFSCGVAAFPLFSDSIELTEAADNALYEAKRKGRNRIILAEK